MKAVPSLSGTMNPHLASPNMLARDGSRSGNFQRQFKSRRSSSQMSGHTRQVGDNSQNNDASYRDPGSPKDSVGFMLHKDKSRLSSRAFKKAT